MKISSFFATFCIIANFSATSSCFFSANANKDQEISNRPKVDVMQNYIPKKPSSRNQYDLNIQTKDTNTKYSCKKQ